MWLVNYSHLHVQVNGQLPPVNATDKAQGTASQPNSPRVVANTPRRQRKFDQHSRATLYSRATTALKGDQHATACMHHRSCVITAVTPSTFQKLCACGVQLREEQGEPPGCGEAQPPPWYGRCVWAGGAVQTVPKLHHGWGKG